MAFANKPTFVVFVKSIRLFFSRIRQSFQTSDSEQICEVIMIKEHEVAVIALIKLGAHINHAVYKTEKHHFAGASREG